MMVVGRWCRREVGGGSAPINWIREKPCLHLVNSCTMNNAPPETVGGWMDGQQVILSWPGPSVAVDRFNPFDQRSIKCGGAGGATWIATFSHFEGEKDMSCCCCLLRFYLTNVQRLSVLLLCAATKSNSLLHRAIRWTVIDRFAGWLFVRVDPTDNVHVLASGRSRRPDRFPPPITDCVWGDNAKTRRQEAGEKLRNVLMRLRLSSAHL